LLPIHCLRAELAAATAADSQRFSGAALPMLPLPPRDADEDESYFR
jgi:hypothetical protein